MKIIEPEAILLPVNAQCPARDIELIAKVCTAKEGNISDDSHVKFVKSLIEKKHEAVLEHRRIAVSLPVWAWQRILYKHVPVMNSEAERLTFMHARINDAVHLTRSGRYLDVTAQLTDVNGSDTDRILVTGNIHAWRDFLRVASFTCRDLVDTLLYAMCKQPTVSIFFEDLLTPDRYGHIYDIVAEQFEITVDTTDCFTVLMVCDRGVSHEIVRHRVALTQSSTRWIRYLTLIFINCTRIFKWNGLRGLLKTLVWKFSLQVSAVCYALLLKLGCKPQEARNVLPNSMSTRLYVTGTRDEWNKLLLLRTDKTAHPEARDIAIKAARLLMEHMTLSPEVMDNIRTYDGNNQ